MQETELAWKVPILSDTIGLGRAEKTEFDMLIAKKASFRVEMRLFCWTLYLCAIHNNSYHDSHFVPAIGLFGIALRRLASCLLLRL